MRPGLQAIAELGTATGVSKILAAKTGPGLLPEEISPTIVAAHEQFGFTHIVAAATAAGKVRSLLDSAMRRPGHAVMPRPPWPPCPAPGQR